MTRSLTVETNSLLWKRDENGEFDDSPTKTCDFLGEKHG